MQLSVELLVGRVVDDAVVNDLALGQTPDRPPMYVSNRRSSPSRREHSRGLLEGPCECSRAYIGPLQLARLDVIRLDDGPRVLHDVFAPHRLVFDHSSVFNYGLGQCHNRTISGVYESRDLADVGIISVGSSPGVIDLLICLPFRSGRHR